MNRNLILTLAAFIVGGLVAGYYILQSGSSDDNVALVDGPEQEAFSFSCGEFPEFQSVLEPSNRQEFLTPHVTDTSFGDPQAPVTIIEFFSYACPHCKDFHEENYQRVLAEYVDAGLVHFVKRDYLLNRDSVGFELRAGAGSQCLADDAQKKQFADLVFAQQRVLARAADPIEALVPVFMASGLEESMARSCMTDQRNLSLVFGRSLRASETAQVQGTPTLFINQELYSGGATNYAALSEAIERAIANAG